MELVHPSGCGCPPPEIIDGGRLVLSVHTCPICLKWEEARRYAQVELPLGEGVHEFMRGEDSDYSGDPQPHDVLAEIRSVDPSF